MTLHYGKALARDQRNPNGAVPVYGANGIKDTADCHYAEGPTLVIGRKGSAGQITRVDGPFWPLDVTYFTSHNQSRLDFDFLKYTLGNLNLPELARGVKPGINRNNVYTLSIPLPPLEEQRRIVAVLDEAFEGLDRARAHAEANIQNARELFESYLTELFTHPDQSWETTQLSRFCEKITVGHVGPMAKRYTTSGTPFLRSQNVRPFEIDLTDVKYIDDGFMNELKKSELRPGDVAIVRTGYPGTCAVIPDDLKVANCADLVIARTGSKLNPHFLALLLNSSYGKNLVAGAAVGAAQKHFNVGAAKRAIFPFPALETQERLVEQASDLRAATLDLEMIASAKSENLDELRQSLLQRAFAGELT